MFTWEWLQPTLQAPLAESEPYLSYRSDLRAAVRYATSHGVAVTIGPYGYSQKFWAAGSGETTPSWRGVGAGNSVSYTKPGRRAGGQQHRVRRPVDPAGHRLRGRSDGLLQPDQRAAPSAHCGVVRAAAQHTINAIRATGSTASILVPGNAFASYDVAATHAETSKPKRSNADGWANANGPGPGWTSPA